TMQSIGYLPSASPSPGKSPVRTCSTPLTVKSKPGNQTPTEKTSWSSAFLQRPKPKLVGIPVAMGPHGLSSSLLARRIRETREAPDCYHPRLLASSAPVHKIHSLFHEKESHALSR